MTERTKNENSPMNRFIKNSFMRDSIGDGSTTHRTNQNFKGRRNIRNSVFKSVETTDGLREDSLDMFAV
jgi:hypothetical protein